MDQTSKKLAAIVLFVVGLGLIYWGYQISGSMGSQLNELVEGTPGDGVMIRYIAGAACLVAGVFLYAKK